MPTSEDQRLSLEEDKEGRWRAERSEPGGRAKLSAPASARDSGEGSRPSRARPLSADAADVALLRARAREAVPAAIADRLPDGALEDLVRQARAEGREIVGTDSLLTDLAGRLLEAALRTELTDHLGFEPHHEPPGGAGNTRNGSTPKTVLTEHGAVRLAVPRDRQGSFEPQIVPKGARRVDGIDDQVLALYAGGMTVREIEKFLARIYGPGVKRDTISRITEVVLADAQEWQTRPLEEIYAVLYLDAVIVKIRDGQAVRHFACYLAVGVNLDGERDVLGMWFQRTEGARFWLQVLTELKQRGVKDVLVCCVDGLEGFPDAIEATFRDAWVQTCVVHKIRASLRFVPYGDRRAVAADLKKIYTAVDRDHAERELERFAEKWDPGCRA